MAELSVPENESENIDLASPQERRLRVIPAAMMPKMQNEVQRLALLVALSR